MDYNQFAFPNYVKRQKGLPFKLNRFDRWVKKDHENGDELNICWSGLWMMGGTLLVLLITSLMIVTSLITYFNDYMLLRIVLVTQIPGIMFHLIYAFSRCRILYNEALEADMQMNMFRDFNLT